MSLRYFNVVGSATDEVYDASPHNLFPLVIEALLAGRTPRINGEDYPTPDGTCVRDYVHVGDLADCHVAAALALAEGRPLRPAYNLGSGGRAEHPADHGRDGAGHRDRVHSRDRVPASGRPGTDRRRRVGGCGRPGLEDELLARRDGVLGVVGAQGVRPRVRLTGIGVADVHRRGVVDETQQF